jgi:hypothetical protein
MFDNSHPLHRHQSDPLKSPHSLRREIESKKASIMEIAKRTPQAKANAGDEISEQFESLARRLGFKPDGKKSLPKAVKLDLS